MAVDRRGGTETRVLPRPAFPRARPCPHPAGALLDPLALAPKRLNAEDDRMGFVGAVPVLPHMNPFWRADHQLRRLRLGVNGQNAYLGRILTQIGKNPVPLELLVIPEEGLRR